MNNEDLLKALGKFSPADILNAIENTKKKKYDRLLEKDTVAEMSGSDVAKDVEKFAELERQMEYDRFIVEDDFSHASYDRKMIRVFLDEHALQNPSFPELHKWWDGTGYAITNDWLFADNQMELGLELVNKDGEMKSFKMKVSF